MIAEALSMLDRNTLNNKIIIAFTNNFKNEFLIDQKKDLETNKKQHWMAR